ncbi:MAG TPA: DUF885 family protein [Sphingomonas sp.]|nr:DUF885 family protein [Sphingomonas sp.]
MIGRRELLIGAATAAALSGPARLLAASGDADARLRRVLDGLAALPDPAAKLARLAPLSTAGLSHSAMLDLVTARQGLAIDARLARVFPFGAPGGSPYVVGPSSGAWRDAAKSKTAPALAGRIEDETRRIAADARAGVQLPQPFLDRTVAAIRAVAADGVVGAALARQAAVLASLRGSAGDSPGVWRLPRGRAWYALMLERSLGEPIDPAAAHRRLMREWETLAARADRLLAAQGFTRGSVGERFVAMFRDPRWHYPDSSAGRDRAVADMNATLDKARARVPELIGPVPRFCLDVTVRRMSPAEEAARKGGYRIVATPTTAGAYFVDLADIARRPSWSLGSVVHHELLPGHMIQLPIEAAADPHPLRTEYAPAFAEGWGVYAEALAAETGAFAGDDPMLLGNIHWLLFRIGRGIVDTGIHYARWSLAKAQETLRETQGEPAYFAPFSIDIDRVALEPGIRAAEALTWLRLADLRTRMARNGRPADAMRRFHQLVLADGRKRLETIEAEISIK